MDEARENIDIGGPAMIRAAAKNFPHVAVVVSPSRYQAVLEALRRDGGIPASLSLELAVEAFQRTAAYDSHIVAFSRNKLGSRSCSQPSSTCNWTRWRSFATGKTPISGPPLQGSNPFTAFLGRSSSAARQAPFLQ